MRSIQFRSRPVARPWRAFAVVALLWAASARPAAAVSVSPAALYLDARTRTGALTLTNNGTRPEEIEISFAFGYPRSDSTGKVDVPLVQVAPAGEPSAAGWLRAFPRRLVLEPGQSQVVRVLAQPPAGLAEGEYWARLLVTSRGGQTPVEQMEGDIRVLLDVQTVVVTAVTYRQGSVATGVAATGAQSRATPAGVELRLDLERQGSAAYLGRVRAELLDANGRVVARGFEDVAVYRSIRRIVLIPLAQPLTGGGYSVRYTLESERPDLPPGGALPAPKVTGTVPVR